MRFNFAIDKDKIIKSDEFILNVWMPRNWRANFTDGDALFLDTENTKRKLSLSRISGEESNYPFL